MAINSATVVAEFIVVICVCAAVLILARHVNHGVETAVPLGSAALTTIQSLVDSRLCADDLICCTADAFNCWMSLSVVV